VLEERRPDAVIVVGDVNSTLGCALPASRVNVPVAHVEAGLRSFDMAMPEEVNRILTDRLSTWLFTTCRDANENLRKEGVTDDRVHFVGNVMVDSLQNNRQKAAQRSLARVLGLQENTYVLVTLHRPENVDSRNKLHEIMEALNILGKKHPVIFPVHPRTSLRLAEFGCKSGCPGLRLINPLGYLDFLSLEQGARLVLTDSGGIQEETTVLGIPCLTIRRSTERPITITEGTNKLVEADRWMIEKEAFRILRGEESRGRMPEKWDGESSGRIASILLRDLLQ
jgi:UDP-N-acetylglucosamine 2-epimerase (non-hydrolysing)